MKPLLLFLTFTCTVSFTFAQQIDNEFRANAYFQEAVKAYENSDYEKVIYYCGRVEDLNRATNLELEELRMKSFYKSEQHEKAKIALEKFLSFNPSAQELLEIEPYIVKIEEAENYRIQKEKEEIELRERLEKEAYNQAITGTPYDIKIYLSQHTDGEHYDELFELLKQKEEDLYLRIDANMDRADIEEYYKYFSNGKYMDEVKSKVEELEEYEFYTKVLDKNTEEAFESYLAKFPGGRYETEINQAYAEYVFQNGESHLEMKNYNAARNYFNFYENRFPDGMRIYQVRDNLNETQKGIEREERVKARDRNSFYLMATYVSDKNIGLELGGMSTINRVSVYWTLEARDPLSSIPDGFNAEKIAPEDVNSVHFEDLYLTSTFGLNIRIIYPVWLYVGGGARAGFLKALEGSTLYDENEKNIYILDNKDFIQAFPEAGIGARAFGRMSLKAGLRFVDGVEFKMGVGFVF